MPDVYATIAEVDPLVVRRLGDVLELRAAEPQQQALLRAYLGEVDFPRAAHVLEVGCGTGAVSRSLALWPCVGQVVGVDPSPVFLERARQLANGSANLTFEEADGRELPFEDASFDVVVFHTSLCHMPSPDRAVAEAYRVLRQGGQLAIFEGTTPRQRWPSANTTRSRSPPTQPSPGSCTTVGWSADSRPWSARSASSAPSAQSRLRADRARDTLTLVEHGADLCGQRAHRRRARPGHESGSLSKGQRNQFSAHRERQPMLASRDTAPPAKTCSNSSQLTYSVTSPPQYGLPSCVAIGTASVTSATGE